jgi:hypothetical protein
LLTKGAVAVGTKVYTIPHNSHYIGKYDTTKWGQADAFTSIDISAQNNWPRKYAGAAVSGSKVYMAPYHSRHVGILDTTTDGFSVAAEGAMIGTQNYYGAAAIGTKVCLHHVSKCHKCMVSNAF